MKKELRIRRGSDFITVSGQVSRKASSASVTVPSTESRSNDHQKRVAEINSVLDYIKEDDPRKNDPELDRFLAETAKEKALAKQKKNMMQRATEVQRRGSLFKDNLGERRTSLFNKSSLYKKPEPVIQDSHDPADIKSSASPKPISVQKSPRRLSTRPPPKQKETKGPTTLRLRRTSLDTRKYSCESLVLAEAKVVSSTALVEAEVRGQTFVACDKALEADERDHWKFRIGPQGLGYYYQKVESDFKSKADRRPSSIITCSQGLHHKREGWGRLAIKALLADDSNALRAAAAKTATTFEQLSSNLKTGAKGGHSWYYDDFRIRAGVEFEPLVPVPGDTLLHIALRFPCSPPFIATLLELGADRNAINNGNQKASDIDPLLLQRADDILTAKKAVDADASKGDDLDSILLQKQTGISSAQNKNGEEEKFSYTRYERIHAKNVAMLPTRCSRVQKGEFV